MTDLPPSVPQAESTAVFGRIEVPITDDIPVVTLTHEAVAAIEALPEGSALLIVQRGGVPGERFLLNADRTVAGRSTKSDIFLDDVTVSRKHAEFVRAGDRFIVRDIGSLNGTYVNRQRIDEATLVSGDEVQIGKYRMSFQQSQDAAE